MIGMIMSDEHGIGRQLVELKKMVNSSPLPLCAHTRIDDKTSSRRFVPNHIALFLKRIALKGFDFHFLLGLMVLMGV